MADGYLKFSCHNSAPIVLDRFSGVSDPTVWINQAEHYFNFYGFSKDMWLSLPSLYFDGEALAWFNWLYRNKQFYDWKHFTDKLAYQYRRHIVTELGLSPVPDLLLQLNAKFSRIGHHLDNIQNTLSACSQKFCDAQARPDLTASSADKCDIEEAPEQESVSSIKENKLNTTENFEFPHMMLEPRVANSKVHPELLDSKRDSSTSIPFPSSLISFSCVETLVPMLESKNDLKDDPSSYACNVFAEMPYKKIDMEVDLLVINDSENPAPHMFDERFQTVCAVKEEYSGLIMFDNNRLTLPCLLSACSHTQLMGRSIIGYFKEFDHAKIPLSLYRFHTAQFRFNFSFDPGSSLLIISFGTTNYYSDRVVVDFKGIIRMFTCYIDSMVSAQCVLLQFPFDPGANLFIIPPGGCLQVSTLQPEASNWDPTICSKSMTHIELTARVSVYPCRKSHLVLLFALSDEHKVRHLDMNVSEICMLKITTATPGSYRIDYYFRDMSISSFLLVTIVKREFQQQFNFIGLTTCSPEMSEFIKFEVRNAYWTGYLTKPTTDIFDDALAVSLYHDVLDVAGQICREGSAQLLNWMNILDCILNLPKLMVSINYTRNVDTPLGFQNEATNSRNHVAWVFDISLHKDITSFLVPLANKVCTVTKGYIAPKGHTKLLVSVISHIYNVEIVFFESLYLLKPAEWSRPVISKIWSTVMPIGKVVRKLPTPTSNLLLLVSKSSFISPMRIIIMISILCYLNLEDKVLIGVVGIVMNGPRPILAKQPNTGLSGYV